MSKIPRLFELMAEKYKKAPAKRLHSARRGIFQKNQEARNNREKRGLQDCSSCIFIIPYLTNKVNEKPKIRNNGKIGGVAQETRQTISPAGFRYALCWLP